MRLLKLKDEQGGTLVETAIAATVMLGVIFSFFELFMAFYAYHYVSYAARDAARYAIVRGSDCSTDSKTMTDCDVTQTELQTYVQGLNFPGINANDVTVALSQQTAVYTETATSVTTSWSPCTANAGCDAPGNADTVTVTYAFPLNLPFFDNKSLSFSSTSQMVISQ
ncbi:MAG TPA: TadE/TadG family type IV pilus assembly protein [Acidobacteriaceae bacterium]|nr:TadE/TadG family type IV pilus assembly protein [Acidobacteriaceae bacterium]